MKKLLASLFLLVSLSAQAQEEIQTIDSSFTNGLIQKDTILLESAPKKTFNEKLGKFLGIDKTEEIETLKKKIQSQTSIITSQSNLIDSLNVAVMKPKIVIKTVPLLNEEQTKSIRKDEKFVNSLPKSYSNVSKDDLAKLTKEIDDKIEELIKQRDVLISKGGNDELVMAKSNIIQSLQREKSVINLSTESTTLKTKNTTLTDENDVLKLKSDKLKRYLYISVAILFVLMLIIAVTLQRKKINIQDIEIDKQLKDINQKNAYLEHAAKIIRHDMHSGINTYIPRGLTSLEKKLTEEDVEKLKLKPSLKMIKEGLAHTQKVYKSVYEFTNLVKQNVVLDKKMIDLKELIKNNLENTSYANQVKVDDLISIEANETLFWNALDNLIKNGIKYNNSETKLVHIYMEGENLVLQDNGVGLSTKDFDKIINQFVSKDENSSGLGLNICSAIFKEHGFAMNCEKLNTGTKIIITLNKTT